MGYFFNLVTLECTAQLQTLPPQPLLRSEVGSSMAIKSDCIGQSSPAPQTFWN